MSTLKDILELYGFNDHPLAPAADKNLYLKSLDPRPNKDIVDYYFYAHYRRYNIEPIVDMDTGAPDLVPYAGGPPKVFILSGGNKSGRNSLKNLVLYQIEVAHQDRPLLVEHSLNSRNLDVQVRDMALALVDNLVVEEGDALEERLRKIIADAETSQVGTGEGRYDSAFGRFKTFIRIRRPFVFVLSGIDRLDTWTNAYRVLSTIASYIIIISADEKEAEVAYKKMDKDARDVMWVHASRIDQDMAKSYVSTIFARQRLPTLSPDVKTSLQPLTEELLESMYQPGPSAREGERVTHPLGLVNATLRKVLDEHFHSLELQAPGEVPASQIPAERRLVKIAQLQAARAQLNRGA